MSVGNIGKQARALPLRNCDIDDFRVQHGLTISEACECLGLQRVRWTAMLKKPAATLEDNSVCQILEFYREHPDTIPIKRIPDVREYALSLGLDPDSPKDKTRLSILHATEKASAYRWLDHGSGRPSAPVERLMAAVTRLPAKTEADRLAALEKVMKAVARRQGIADPLRRGTWRRDDEIK